MKVFISHSGERSRALANKLEWFVRNLVPSTEPWISTGIDKGSRWEPEIAENLENAGMGIVCLTRENLDSRWILFEAGALSKKLGDKVATFLLDVEPAQVQPPLGQFQHTRASRPDTLDLVMSINNAVGQAKEKIRNLDDLRESFDLMWPKLEATIGELRAAAAPAAPPARGINEMVGEVLEVVRDLARKIDARPYTYFDPLEGEVNDPKLQWKHFVVRSFSDDSQTYFKDRDLTRALLLRLLNQSDRKLGEARDQDSDKTLVEQPKRKDQQNNEDIKKKE